MKLNECEVCGAGPDALDFEAVERVLGRDLERLDAVDALEHKRVLADCLALRQTLSALLHAFAGLRTSYATPEQQRALAAAYALVGEPPKPATRDTSTGETCP